MIGDHRAQHVAPFDPEQRISIRMGASLFAMRTTEVKPGTLGHAHLVVLGPDTALTLGDKMSAMRTASLNGRGPRSQGGVAVVAKAVEVLEWLGDGRPWRVADLAVSAGISRSTAYRILETLETKGWVQRQGAVRRYTLGPAARALGSVRHPTDELVRAARPFMRRLWESYGETVNLGIPVGEHILYLDLIESSQRLKTTSRVGTSDPFHSTALGKAILALQPDREARALLVATERSQRTPRTIVELDRLLDDLGSTRARGYAIDDEENEVGSRCVAAGVRDAEARPIAAISVSAPAVRLDGERIGEIGRAVRRSGRDLEAALGRSTSPDVASGSSA